MRKKTVKTNLKRLFDIPNNHIMTLNDFRYHASLVPSIRILKKIKAIDFKVTLKRPSKNHLNELIHHNSVNTHIFKPKYFLHSEDKLVCYVSSQEVLAHTLRSLAIISNKHLKKDIKVSITYYPDRYMDYVQNDIIGSNVLIARVESLVNFLRMMWLIESRTISRRNIDGLFREIELGRLRKIDQEKLVQRLETKYLKKSGLSFCQIDKKLKLQRHKSKSPYIEFAKFELNGTPVSVIQLPWGHSMSVDMLKTITKNGNNIHKLAIVGGVGYLGKDKSKIDDIFVPKNLIVSDGKNTSSLPITNAIFELPDQHYIFKKNMVSGNIFSVRPSFGEISYTKHVRDVEEIHAYDMEKEAILKMLNGSKIRLASNYYIMDFPYTNLDLGGTYYSRKFLKRLFSKSNRGKYFCFERALAFLATNHE